MSWAPRAVCFLWGALALWKDTHGDAKVLMASEGIISGFRVWPVTLSLQKDSSLGTAAQGLGLVCPRLGCGERFKSLRGEASLVAVTGNRADFEILHQ